MVDNMRSEKAYVLLRHGAADRKGRATEILNSQRYSFSELLPKHPSHVCEPTPAILCDIGSFCKVTRKIGHMACVPAM
ncbi:hypothetical protein TNCT_235231 [Trichonephila clavata]|uniref:Uncharacterized protein n=1 Tax=Trichonephila clavata TaxID=2740835 RepID=A0A8X6LMD1_TRICU|nr:hypothetical protein TNCT_235231 [Trichonephila clavata]